MQSKKIKLRAKKKYSRIDHFLTEYLMDLSRSKIGKLIKNNRVKLNNKLINRKNKEILIDDIVEVELIKPENKEYSPSFYLKKLFEDPHILIIDKPTGTSVHPGAGEKHETILDIFMFCYPQIKDIKNTNRPGIVHRLDRDTSGILVLAKDETTKIRLQKSFKRREIKKTYLALISGKMREKNGTINRPIKRSQRNRKRFMVAHQNNSKNARESITKFSIIQELNEISFIKLFPITGRTHQIRVHLSHYGNPVLGDRIYGTESSFERLALHSYSIEFFHPITGNLITAFSPLPEVFRNFLKNKMKPKSIQ